MTKRASGKVIAAKKPLKEEQLTLPDLDPSLKTKLKKSTIIHTGAEKPKAKKTAHYVDNQRFYTCLVAYQIECAEAKEAGRPKPRASDYIGECILKICTKLSSLYSFSQYTYRDELVGSAIETCIMKLGNFNPKKTANPFAYFTQIAYYSFITTIAEEKTEAYVKYRSIIERLTSSELADSPEDMSEVAEHAMDNIELQIDHLQQYVHDYEAKKKAKLVAEKARKQTAIDDLFQASSDAIKGRNQPTA